MFVFCERYGKLTYRIFFYGEQITAFNQHTIRCVKISSVFFFNDHKMAKITFCGAIAFFYNKQYANRGC
jgi:hypothetical protein